MREMTRRRFVSAALALIGAGATGGAAAALEKIPDLDGRWFGAGLDLFIDTTRLQGNADPAKPFNRQSFFIRNVTGPMVVFVIGPEVFFARMDDPNTMVVSRGGLPDTYTLKRLRRR